MNDLTLPLGKRFLRFVIMLISLASLSSVEAVAQTATTVPYFTSLCIADEAVGFNWRNGRWTFTRFQPERYTFQKIDLERYRQETVLTRRPLLCSDAEVTKITNGAIVKACYVVHRFGEQPFLPGDASMCYESHINGNLELIQCPGVGNFLPNGLFVKLPVSTSMLLKDESTKDSMVVSVGKCGVVN